LIPEQLFRLVSRSEFPESIKTNDRDEEGVFLTKDESFIALGMDLYIWI
jgi:hypothetical protein